MHLAWTGSTGENLESSGNRRLLLWPVLLACHFFLAVAGGMLIGFFPEALIGRAYYNTGLEPYSPAVAVSALLLGYFVSLRLFSLRAATWTWLVGVVWLLVGVHELTKSWSASWSAEKTRYGYALANLFGPTLKCSGSECLYELFYTTPFTASVTYSIGVFLRKRLQTRQRRQRHSSESVISSTSRTK